MIRDIIASIKRFANEGERFKIFARFIGVEDILSNDIVRKKRGNKYEEFLSNFYYTSHMGITDYLEFCLLIKSYEMYEDTSMKPFVSFPVSKRS